MLCDIFSSVRGFEDSEFPVYMTPIVLAAQLDRVEIIRILSDHGHSEIHPISSKVKIAHTQSKLIE